MTEVADCKEGTELEAVRTDRGPSKNPDTGRGGNGHNNFHLSKEQAGLGEP